jgi:hypothetical protein
MDDSESDDFEISADDEEEHVLTAVIKTDPAKQTTASVKSKAAAKPKTVAQQRKPPVTLADVSTMASKSVVKVAANDDPLLTSDDITRGPNVSSEAAAKKLVLAYLRQQNRPYSAIQVRT